MKAIVFAKEALGFAGALIYLAWLIGSNFAAVVWCMVRHMSLCPFVYFCRALRQAWAKTVAETKAEQESTHPGYVVCQRCGGLKPAQNIK